jgi:fluoroquinolone resistance protein
MWSRADLGKCDLRGSDVSSLDPGGVQLGKAIVDWPQAVMIARNLGLDVRSD